MRQMGQGDSHRYSLELGALSYLFFIQSCSSNDPINHNLIQNQGSHVLVIGMIVCVISEERMSRLYSMFFIVWKCMRVIRAILNVKRFNKWMKKTKFQMEILTSTESSLSQGDFLTSVDPVDAYPH